MTAWSKQVVLFSIDCAGTSFEQADMPNFYRVSGNVTVNNRHELTNSNILENVVFILMEESQEL